MNLTPSTFHGVTTVGSLPLDDQTELRRKLRDLCLEMVEFLSLQSISDPLEHRTVAYAIVV